MHNRRKELYTASGKEMVDHLIKALRLAEDRLLQGAEAENLSPRIVETVALVTRAIRSALIDEQPLPETLFAFIRLHFGEKCAACNHSQRFHKYVPGARLAKCIWCACHNFVDRGQIQTGPGGRLSDAEIEALKRVTIEAGAK